MTTLRTSLLSIVLAVTVFLPALATAQGLVPCDNSLPRDANGQITGTTIANPCNFEALITLISNVLKYLIYDVATPLAAIMFAIAGYLYLTAGDDPGKVKRAHDIFISVLWGFGIMLIAWALVSFILNFFTTGTTYNLLAAPNPF